MERVQSHLKFSKGSEPSPTMNKKRGVTELDFELLVLKAKIKGVLTDWIVAMVNCYIKKNDRNFIIIVHNVRLKYIPNTRLKG